MENTERRGRPEIQKPSNVEGFFEKYPSAEVILAGKVDKISEESGPEAALSYVLQEEAMMERQLADWNRALPKSLHEAFPKELKGLLVVDRHVFLDQETEAMVEKMLKKAGGGDESAELARKMIWRLSTMTVAADALEEVREELEKEIGAKKEVHKAA